MKEQREVFKKARELLKGSFWEEIVFPKPMSPEDIAFKKEVDRIEDHYYNQRQNIENAINDFFGWERNTEIPLFPEDRNA